MRLDIDPNKLTLGEMKLFEKVGGDFAKPNSAYSLAAFVFIYMRRDNPQVTMEEVDALNISEIEVDTEQEAGKLDPKATTNSET